LLLFHQLMIALFAGPIDGAFNKGNTPAFGMAGAFALICAVLAVVLLPKTRGMSGTAVMAGGH
jgi:solute carrier family 45, member 1/2/4